VLRRDVVEPFKKARDQSQTQKNQQELSQVLVAKLPVRTSQAQSGTRDKLGLLDASCGELKAPMFHVKEQANRALRQLIGLKLSRMALAADMRTIQFGITRPGSRGVVGEYALHVQCPWRIERECDGQIITGSGDLCEPCDENDQRNESFNLERGNSLQEQILRGLLQGYDERTRQIVNSANLLVVNAVEADSFGGFRLELSGGFQFIAFPNASRGEAWRLFRPTADGERLAERHFVVPPEDESAS